MFPFVERNGYMAARNPKGSPKWNLPEFHKFID